MSDKPPPANHRHCAIVDGVRADLLARQQLGLVKYGHTLAENPAEHRARLQHAYEEALDAACYLKWAMSELPN